MKILYTIVLTALFATSALAADNDRIRKAAERYINSPTQQKMMDQMMSKDVMLAQLSAQFPALAADEKKMALVLDIVSEELETIRPAMETAMIDAAAESFSYKELVALDKFYRTEEGQAVAEKMQPFMTLFYGKIGADMQKMQGSMIQKITAAISEE